MPRLMDETGKRYGRLTVTGRAPNKVGHLGAIWNCLCECGKTTEVRGRSLRSGHSASCGCVRRERITAATRRPFGLSSRNNALTSMKRNARVRGYAWAISDDLVFDLMTRPCHYCGSPPSNVAKSPNSYGQFSYSGIDRVDNTRGYEADNVVPACKLCNNAKLTLRLEDFLAWAARLYQHSIASKEV